MCLKGINQKEIAKVTNFAQSYVSRIETNIIKKIKRQTGSSFKPVRLHSRDTG